MRVIGGKLKGKRLVSPRGDNVRPTLDRIKETLFNIIQFDVADSVFLDLFALTDTGGGAERRSPDGRGADGRVDEDGNGPFCPDCAEVLGRLGGS